MPYHYNDKFICILCLCAPLSVFAQAAQPVLDDGQLAPGQTVADRQHEGYSATGIKMGAFTLSPSVKLSEIYTDNLFFENANPSDDFISQITPKVTLQSNWSNHSLKLGLGADIFRHVDNSAEDAEDYGLDVQGRLDIARETKATLNASLNRGHEGRGSPDAVNGRNPTKTDTQLLTLGFEHRPGRFFALGNATISELDYDNVQTSLGATINNQDRNRSEQGLSLTGGYEIQPGFNGFLRLSHDKRAYDSPVDDNGFNRDSTANKVELGLEINLSSLLNGELSLGNVERDYDDARFNTTSSLSTASTLYWQASPLTTFIFNASRDVSETTENLASGIVSTGFNVGAAHELRRNILLEASVNLTQNKFKAITRTDDLFSFNLSANYDVSRAVHLGASYEYSQRDSDAAGVNYDRNALMFSIELRR